MEERELAYSAATMTKEQFFYAYKQLAQNDDHHLLLESGRDGKLCIAGIDPLATLRAVNEDALHIIWRDGLKKFGKENRLTSLPNLFVPMKSDLFQNSLNFKEGLAGFISYDYVRQYENLPSDTEDDLRYTGSVFLSFR